MQMRASSVSGSCPKCPLNSNHPVHRHGHYERYGDIDSTELIAVKRFLCTVCQRTVSVLPDRCLPYWSLPAHELEAYFNVRSGLSPDSDPGWSIKKQSRYWMRGSV